MGSRIDRQTQATARQVENLAGLLPELRDHIRLELHHLDGSPDKYPGSVEPELLERRGTVMSGKCSGSVQTVDGFVVACGRLRPCGEHDFPVQLTPPERVAEQRLRLQRELEDVEQRARTIRIIADGALADARRLMGERAPKADRCTGGVGRDGHIEWGDPTCTRVPERDGGLCSACWMREARWRTKHDLPARDRALPHAG